MLCVYALGRCLLFSRNTQAWVGVKVRVGFRHKGLESMRLYTIATINSFTYDHRTLRTLHPVCSAFIKQRTGGLVVRWVTTSEYPLLYVFAVFTFFLYSRSC
jgi:hypothetical protein